MTSYLNNRHGPNVEIFLLHFPVRWDDQYETWLKTFCILIRGSDFDLRLKFGTRAGKVQETTTLLLVNLPNIHRFKTNFIHILSNKPFLIIYQQPHDAFNMLLQYLVIYR